MLRFSWFDNIAHQNIVIDQVALTPAELADSQLELDFSHDSTSGDAVTASHAFAGSNTLVSFNGTLIALGTDSSTDVFTPALNWAQAGFEAVDAVPEPSSLAILALALCGLGAFRRYAK